MSRERKILSHPLSNPDVEKKVLEAFRELKRDARDGRSNKKESSSSRKK
jgi:hypothetical protein